MFTSRAEYRLSLRADNADLRLTPVGMRVGIVSKDRAERFHGLATALETARSWTKALSISPSEAGAHGLTLNQDGVRRTAYELLSFPDVDLARLAAIWPELQAVGERTTELLETEARYAVYLDRQDTDSARIRAEEHRSLPSDLDFENMPGLSNELKRKLENRRPRTLADAQKIEGMTPAALALILAHSRRIPDSVGYAA